MNNARPIYKKLLIVAITLYIISSVYIQSDLCNRVGILEDKMSHILGDTHR
jgi:hypothetical protein